MRRRGRGSGSARDRLIELEMVRRDVRAYRRIPPTAEEASIAETADRSDLADDTDWETLYEGRG